MTWFKNFMKWARVLWSLRHELERVHRMIAEDYKEIQALRFAIEEQTKKQADQAQSEAPRPLS